MHAPPEAVEVEDLRALTARQLEAARADDWDRVEALDAERVRALRAFPESAVRPAAQVRELLELDAELVRVARAARAVAATGLHEARHGRRASAAYRAAAELEGSAEGAGGA